MEAHWRRQCHQWHCQCQLPRMNEDHESKILRRKMRQEKKRKILLIASAAYLLQALCALQAVHCSSYLGDYFLPTAKIALNKIQQSLAPAQPTALPQGQVLASSAPVGTPTSGATTATVVQAPGAANGTLEQRQEMSASGANKEPNKNEFVKLDVLGPTDALGERPANNYLEQAAAKVEEPTNGPINEAELGAVPAATSGQQPEAPPMVISSTLATDSDFSSSSSSSTIIAGESSSSVPTSADTNEPPSSPSLGPNFTYGDNAKSPATGDKAEIPAVATPPPENSPPASSSETSTSPVGVSQEFTPTLVEQPQPSSSSVTSGGIESKSADESIRETELEAVAAVDASIGFGDPFASMSDSCYDEYGNARYCEPEFENAAFERLVEVSSECGKPPSRFCTAYLNEANDQIRNCHMCDAQNPKKSHPAAYLTDMNNSDSPTCWLSAPISSATSSPPSGGASNVSQLDQQQPMRSDNVTLTLNLDKKYEIIYVSMQFCNQKPDSLAIFKSADYGQTWSPYQFYSSQCKRMYGRQSRTVTGSRSPEAAGLQVSGQPEAVCVNSSSPPASGAASLSSSARVAFSTLEGRGAGGPQALDRSQALQDWITATNIRIVLDRHPANWIHSSLIAHHSAAPSGEGRAGSASGSASSVGVGGGGHKGGANESTTGGRDLESSLTNPSDTYNYAMSDLTVGARCKCNGHASRCIHSKEGKLQCDCRHNTAGRDCEKCAHFHFDRPWARATQLDANPCQPCNCNGHSRKCRFDAELYRLSGRRSGGVCLGCRDNTAGRHCHYCREGFTRDHSKPMSDKEACKHCDCHPIGSLGRVCNQTTGQCPCKEGVAGLQCNRCAPGYQQSSSLSEPCIKLPENDINYEPALTVDSEPGIEPSQQQDSGASPEQSNGAVPSNEPELAQIGPNNANESPQQPAAPQRELQLQASNSRAPPGEARGTGKHRINTGGSLAADPDNSDPGSMNGLDNSDKDDHSEPNSPEDELASQNTLRRPHRPQVQQHNWPPLQADVHFRKQHPYYRYQQHHSSANGQRHQFADSQQSAPQAPTSDELEAPEVNGNEMGRLRPNNIDLMDDDYVPMSVYHLPGGYGAGPAAWNGGGAGKQRFVQHQQHEFRQHQHRRPQHQMAPVGSQRSRLHNSAAAANEILMKPALANLEPGTEDELEVPPGGATYALPHNSAAIYNEAAFNQIQPAPQAPTGRRPSQRQHQTLYRARHRQLAPNGPLQESSEQAAGPGNAMNQLANEVACGDCQTNTRRLGFKQFCHLDYAIKATILSKFMADDWTRFEVEIQDIFKSPGSDPVLGRPGNGNNGPNYIADNLVQADEADPPLAAAAGQPRSSQLANVNGTRPDLLLDSSNESALPPVHRLKVGTVQSIWLPTEDLTCKCPKLKLRFTYLLMGSIDAKKGSNNVLQLDRHSIALEWRSSLQEKLIKYQRRHSRGRC